MINDQYTTEDATQELLRISKWPEPLRLAYLLEKEMLWPLHGRAADELRRLHAIETKLAEQPAPVQEPVGVYGHCPICGAKGVTRERRPDGDDRCANGHTYKSMYATTPPAAQRQWVGLTDDDIGMCLDVGDGSMSKIIYAIERKLKEKNAAAQPAVPDVLFRHAPEHPQYIQGWNDCRAEMLKGMKP